MVSRYPNAIDGYSDIRIVRDSIEEVLARDHNDNRSAVVAVEQTLGLNPQGAYGTVVARLDQSDTDFGEHIGGTAHRHVTNHIDYPGSSPKVFADGYALVSSRLGSTLNEIVARLGASTPAGASGGDKIGITPFTTEHSKYSFPGTSVRSQILKSGEFFDENATLLERTLGAFVVDGMSVTDPYMTGNTARVAAGYIVSDGRLLRYNGGDLSVPISGSPVIYYVLAWISAGSVSVSLVTEASLASVLDPLNPAVLLHKIIRSGATWIVSTDIRRFGLLMNNKNFFSVGNKPSGGMDGYGCDFISLKGAVEYVKALYVAGKLIAPMKIVLVDDIAISSVDELDVVLDLPGLEIDGCGRKITVSGTVTSPLFWIEADRVAIRDLTLVSACSGANFTFFARVARTVSVRGISVVDCGMETSGVSIPGVIFLLLGDPSGTNTVTNSLISGNIVDVAAGGIVYDCVVSGSIMYAQILKLSEVSGNHIFHATFASGPGLYSGIQVSDECVVSDNIVHGGFNTGISLHAPVNTKISDNLIVGTDDTTVFMDLGIASWVPGPNGDAFGAMITDNIIRGVNVCGIDIARPGGRVGRQTIISGNMIDNSNIGTWPSGVIGIKVNRFEVPVIGNKIVWTGYPIDRASFVVGNEIYGHGVAAGDGILCVSYAPTATVCNNRIYNLNCSGSAINVNSTDLATVSGNIIYECVSTGYLGAGINMGRGTQATIVGNVISHSTLATGMMGISDIGDESIVCANMLTNLESGAFYASAAGANRLSFIGNRAYNCGGTGVEMTDTAMSIVTDNMFIVDDPTLGPGPAISGFSSNCLVSGNIIRGYGASGYWVVSGNYGSFQHTTVINNLVFGSHANTSGAIRMSNGWRDIIVSGNIICDTKYKGIDLSGSARAIVSGNLLLGTANSRSGIYRVGQYSVVSNNAILGYGDGGSNNVGISLMDAYSSAVVGNTIAAGADLTWGIYLDAAVATIDNLIVGNVLNSLVYTGIDLNPGFSASHLVANNLIIGTDSLNSAPGIANASTQSVVIGNNLRNVNGRGIDVTGNNVVVVGNSITSAHGNGIHANGDGVLVSSNTVMNPDAYGIHIEANLYSSVVGNYVYSSGASYDGIYVTDSVFTLVNSNLVSNFDSAIRLDLVFFGCFDCLVCGNAVIQDPIGAIGNIGIRVDPLCRSINVASNFVFGSVIGIDIYDGPSSIVSNHVVWCRTAGISAHGADDLNISSNIIGEAYPLTLFMDGIDLTACLRTLVVGNLAFADRVLDLTLFPGTGWGLGMSFRIDASQPTNGLVMTGNLGRCGFGSPSNGSGGSWSSGWNIDVDCRHMFT